MELTILSLVVSIAAALWFFNDLRTERKINESHKRTIEGLIARVAEITKDKQALMRENDKLEAIIDLTRPPTTKLLAPLPEIFSEEEFKTRDQIREEGRAKGRRWSDIAAAPKPSLDWQDQDRQDFNGMGI